MKRVGLQNVYYLPNGLLERFQLMIQALHASDFGFISHMDTADWAENVNPQMSENYDGALFWRDSASHRDPADFAHLNNCKGQNLDH